MSWLSDKFKNIFFGVRIKFGDGNKPKIELYAEKMKKDEERGIRKN